MTDTCDDWGLLIQADLDGELDIATIARLARHIETCPACAGLQRDLLALSSRIRADVPRPTAQSRLASPQWWPAAGTKEMLLSDPASSGMQAVELRSAQSTNQVPGKGAEA